MKLRKGNDSQEAMPDRHADLFLAVHSSSVTDPSTAVIKAVRAIRQVVKRLPLPPSWKAEQPKGIDRNATDGTAHALCGPRCREHRHANQSGDGPSKADRGKVSVQNIPAERGSS